jgi:hypothetical protein
VSAVLFVKEDENLYPNLTILSGTDSGKRLPRLNEAVQNAATWDDLRASHQWHAARDQRDCLRVVEAGATGVMFSEPLPAGRFAWCVNP